jgi:hypothetical protein
MDTESANASLRNFEWIAATIGDEETWFTLLNALRGIVGVGAVRRHTGLAHDRRIAVDRPYRVSRAIASAMNSCIGKPSWHGWQSALASAARCACVWLIR